MPAQNHFVHAFIKRGVLICSLFLILLVAIGVAFQGGGNPQVQQGGSASFPRTAYEAPSTMIWDIVSPSGSVIASDTTPNGWNVAVVNFVFTVTSPSNAPVGTNYKVRNSGMMSEDSMGSKASIGSRSSEKPRDITGRPISPGSKAIAIKPPVPKRSPKNGTMDWNMSSSAYFDVVSANAPPNTPTNLVATVAASNRINLSWQDNSNNEGGFKVYREQTGGSWIPVTTTGANVTSFSDIPLLPATEYTYKIIAVNANGESSPSNLATRTTYSSTVLDPGYTGNDFYVVIPENTLPGVPGGPPSDNGTPQLRITSVDGATGLLTTVESGESIPFTVPAGGSTTVSLSNSRRLHQNDEITKDSYRVTTDNAVSVEFFDYCPFASESWAVLPTSIIGTEYVASAYTPVTGYGSQVALVATDDNTVVTIRPSVWCGSNRAANMPFAVTLQKGETYQLKSNQEDLTGTSIKSTKAIVVLSGSPGAKVPVIANAANPLEEQLLPFDRWQTSYVGVPLAHHPHARFRLTAARNRTNLSVYFGDQDSTSTYLLNAGQTVEVESTSPILVEADKPIQGMQLSNGSEVDFNLNDDASVGDPMMITMPSTYSPNSQRSNWLTNCNIPVSATDGFSYHWVTLISEDHAMTTMYLNGNVINGWQYIGNTRFKYVKVALSSGNNVINGIYQGGAVGVNFAARFLAYGYNFSSYDACGSTVGGITLANEYVNVHPDDPTYLSATAVSASEIDLSWTASQGAYGYLIERKTDTTDWVFVADKADAGTTFQNTGLHHKTKYYYRVMAYADEDSGYSNTASTTTFNEKAAIPTLTSVAAQSDSEMKLIWADNSDNEESFIIERKQGLNGSWVEVKTTPPDATTWTDTNLTKKTTYYYHIKAHNEMGDSEWSSVLGDTTKDTKPTAPSLTTANGVSYSEIDLAWVDNSDNEDGFRIERLNSAGQWVSVGSALPNQTSFHDTTGLSPLTSYTYRVVAFNNGGDSPSNERTGTTLAPPKPNAPTNLIATALTESDIQLSWTDNSTLETGCRIYRRVQGASNWVTTEVPANTTSYLDSGLNASTTYEYQVTAFNTTGESDNSNVASATTEIAPPENGPLYLQSLSISNDCPINGGTTTLVVKISKRTTIPCVVQLSSHDLGISIPSSAIVPPGQRIFAVPCTISSGDQHGCVYGSFGNWTQRATYRSVSQASQISPGNISVNNTNSGNIISWKAPLPYQFGTMYKGYVVERSEDGQPYVRLNDIPRTGFKYCDTATTSGHTYVYRVSLSDSTGHLFFPSASQQQVYSPSFSGIVWQGSATNSGRDWIASYSDPTNSKLVYTFVDSFLDNVSESNSASGFSISIDRAKLSIGNHTVRVATLGTQSTISSAQTLSQSNVGSLRNERYAFPTDGDFPEYSCTLPPDTQSYTIELQSQAGVTIKSWTGIGPNVRVVIDASPQSISDGIRYVIKLKKDAEQFFNDYKDSWWGWLYQPDFLGLITVDQSQDDDIAPGDELPSILMRELGETIQGRLNTRYAQFGQVRPYFIYANKGEVLTLLMKEHLCRWMATTVHGLYVQGHGGDNPGLGDDKAIENAAFFTGYHYFRFGDMKWDNARDPILEGAGIYLAERGSVSLYLLNPLHYYRFAFLNVCGGAGWDKHDIEASTTGQMQFTTGDPLPIAQKWIEALRIPQDENPGQFMAFNGYCDLVASSVRIQNTQWTTYGMFADQFFNYWVTQNSNSGTPGVQGDAYQEAMNYCEHHFAQYGYSNLPVWGHYPGWPLNPKLWSICSTLDGIQYDSLN